MRIAGGLTLVAFGIAIGYAAASQAPAQSELPAERVTGIGGVFFKAKDPRALAVWYRDHLGLVPEPAAGNNPLFKWRDRDDPAQVGNTVWSLFRQDTKYFGPGGATFMLNYRVRNLDRMLAQLKARGVPVGPEITSDFNGRFAWTTDPEGNRIELWEPKAGY